MTAETHRNKTPAQRIFISYRREDTQCVAGRLSDSLSAYFGDQRVFRDSDGIAAGERFGGVIDAVLDIADAVVVLTGNQWLTATNEHGKQRLADEAGWVALEVAAALFFYAAAWTGVLGSLLTFVLY